MNMLERVGQKDKEQTRSSTNKRFLEPDGQVEGRQK